MMIIVVVVTISKCSLPSYCRFCNGVKVGPHWKWTQGHGFIVGELDNENRNIGM